MTVQCAILNPRCVIFASDSGITTPDGKKYDGVQKIFKLSDIHPAKIMINGNMEFENIPITTIINEFKKKTDFNKLKTIEDIKDSFLSFTHNYSPTSDFEEYISYIVDDFKETISLEIEEYGFNKVISTKKKKKSILSLKNILNSISNLTTSFLKMKTAKNIMKFFGKYSHMNSNMQEQEL